MRRTSVLMIVLVLTALFAFAQGSRNNIQIVGAPNSPSPKGDVVFKIVEPADGQVVEGPDVTVKFTIENWKLYKEPAGHGQHIHFILDNQPYEAHYSTEAFIFKNVAPGAHVIRAFPGRPWHESVKQDSAFSMVQFYVVEKGTESAVDATLPMLVYSRPKGEYLISKPPHGQPQDGILVDFFLQNVELGKDGYVARLVVGGATKDIESWQPFYVKGLRPGIYTFRLELLKDGKPVEGNFNSTERTILIKP